MNRSQFKARQVTASQVLAKTLASTLSPHSQWPDQLEVLYLDQTASRKYIRGRHQGSIGTNLGEKLREVLR